MVDGSSDVCSRAFPWVTLTFLGTVRTLAESLMLEIRRKQIVIKN